MSRPDEKTVAAEVLALQSLGVADLRDRYRELYGEDTRSRNRTWLFRACAWRVQELVYGGLSERAVKRAAEIARDCDVRPRRADHVPALPGTTTKVVAFEPTPVSDDPLPGTVLTRKYKGQQISVRVLEDGFEYDGQPYGSLTAVARAVTGSHWNGRAFFGLKKAAS